LIPWLASIVAPSLIVCGSVVMAVGSEPLGTVPPGALVLDQDWHMQSSVLIGDAGARLSMPGQLTAAWYIGTLASLDPALILTPPRGMEAGYIPIATRQELAGAASRPHDQEKAR